MQMQQREHSLLAGETSFIVNNGFINASFRPGVEGPIIIETGASVNETDFSVGCVSDSPSKLAKRVYAQDGKVAKYQLTPVKTGLFQVRLFCSKDYLRTLQGVSRAIFRPPLSLPLRSRSMVP